MIFPLQEGPVSQMGEFKQSVAMFYLNWPVLMILSLNNYPLELRPVSPIGQFT